MRGVANESRCQNDMRLKHAIDKNKTLEINGVSERHETSQSNDINEDSEISDATDTKDIIDAPTPKCTDKCLLSRAVA